MNRKLRLTKSAQQIKDEQIGFLLEDIEQNIEEFKKIIETKNKQLTDKKEILKGVKYSYQELTKENKQLKQYIANINDQQQQQLRQQQQYFRPKNYKKVLYEEETDNKIEQDQEETPELEEIEEQDQQQQ